MAVTQVSYPYDAPGVGQVATESQWRPMALAWASTGVILDPLDDITAQKRSLQVIRKAGARQVSVRNGKAWIDGQFYQLAGGPLDVAIGAPAASPRYDAIVVRNDRGTNAATVVVVPGPPGASPAYPALTRTSSVWDLLLGYQLVSPGDVGALAMDPVDMRSLSFPSGAAVYAKAKGNGGALSATFAPSVVPLAVDDDHYGLISVSDGAIIAPFGGLVRLRGQTCVEPIGSTGAVLLALSRGLGQYGQTDTPIPTATRSTLFAVDAVIRVLPGDSIALVGTTDHDRSISADPAYTALTLEYVGP